MDARSAAHADVSAHAHADRCSDVELEARVTAAHDRQATAFARLEELTTVEQQLGRRLLTMETELTSTRSQVESEAAAILDDAEARTADIARRRDEAAAQLLELADAIRSGRLDPERRNLLRSSSVVDLSEVPGQGAQSTDPFLDALRTSVFDDSTGTRRTAWSRSASRRRDSGTRCAIGCDGRAARCPEASNNGCASREH
jgi:hypothetical protein